MSRDPEIRPRDMSAADVEAVLAIEQRVHGHPWTRGMFNDSLASGHICTVFESGQEIVGYAVLMPAPDEAHLLNISIAGVYQRKGFGSKLFNIIKELCIDRQFGRIILEVRRSNVAANALYRKVGFAEIGVRRGYYPAANGREDAIVMEYKLQ